MITNLKISNYALIDNLDISFERGFSVITGETGAGKSIILGALSMLLGHRADAKAVKTDARKCIVEAHFNIEGYGMEMFFEENDIEYDSTDCILRREMSSTGKSRAFINDTPVSLSILRSLGERLVDIHSQHQNLMLGNADFQLSVIDIIAGNEAERKAYSEAYTIFKKEERKLCELKEAMEESRKQEDFMRFQLSELEDASLSDPDELEILEQKSETMDHAEEIKSSLYTACSLLDSEESGIIPQLKKAGNLLSSIENILPQTKPLSERIDSAYIELKDISYEASSIMDDVDFDPSEQQDVNDRLDALYTLTKKYHCDTIAELIGIRDSLSQRISLIDNSEETLKEQELILEKTRKQAMDEAGKLSATRLASAETVEKEIKQSLATLGMPNVQFSTDIERKELGATGQDSVTFMFSANQGMALQPIAKVASGGEIARVMLSLKAMISNAVSLPTIIFDEIDTGVSGKIAEAMAKIMFDMGNGGRQVVSITHLPQIAAAGKYHYNVRKAEVNGQTKTDMVRLTDEERISEIAQMLSGSTISDAARHQATELLSLYSGK